MGARGSCQLDDTRQIVRATVGPGEIGICNQEQQAGLEQSGTTDPLSELNRDPGNAFSVYCSNPSRLLHSAKHFD